MARRRGFQLPLSKEQIVAIVVFLLTVLPGLAVVTSFGKLSADRLVLSSSIYGGLLLTFILFYVYASAVDPSLSGGVDCVCMKATQSVSRYCRICEKNVLGLDHHCAWLNTCIGRRNYFAFYFMNFNGFLLMVAHILFTSFSLTVWKDIAISTGVTVVISIICGVSLLCLFGFSSLWFFHNYLLSQSIGTYDWLVRRQERRVARIEQRSIMAREQTLRMNGNNIEVLSEFNSFQDPTSPIRVRRNEDPLHSDGHALSNGDSLLGYQGEIVVGSRIFVSASSEQGKLSPSDNSDVDLDDVSIDIDTLKNAKDTFSPSSPVGVAILAGSVTDTNLYVPSLPSAVSSPDAVSGFSKDNIVLSSSRSPSRPLSSRGSRDESADISSPRKPTNSSEFYPPRVSQQSVYIDKPLQTSKEVVLPTGFEKSVVVSNKEFVDENPSSASSSISRKSGSYQPITLSPHVNMKWETLSQSPNDLVKQISQIKSKCFDTQSPFSSVSIPASASPVVGETIPHSPDLSDEDSIISGPSRAIDLDDAYVGDDDGESSPSERRRSSGRRGGSSAQAGYISSSDNMSNESVGETQDRNSPVKPVHSDNLIPPKGISVEKVVGVFSPTSKPPLVPPRDTVVASKRMVSASSEAGQFPHTKSRSNSSASVHDGSSIHSSIHVRRSSSNSSLTTGFYTAESEEDGSI